MPITDTKIDSNVTGLRYAEEDGIGALPVTPIWRVLEPNSYADFGGEITTVARNPINPSRQRQKGVVTDLDASGGFNTDITQTNLQDLLQGVFQADLRRKTELASTATTSTAYTVASDGTDFDTGDLLFASGFSTPGNNGFKTVTGSTGTSVSVTGLTMSTSQSGQLVAIGVEADTDDIEVENNAGTFPTLTSSVLDFTTLGLIPGEWIYIGGDAINSEFDAAAQINGFARVRSISANELSLDKTEQTPVTNDGSGKSIQLYFGRVLKNEIGTLIHCRSYQLERTLGAPDLDFPNQVQAEYLVGAVPNEFTINIPSAERINADLTFVGTNFEQRSSAMGLKIGERPTLIQNTAFNTTSDFSRINLSQIVDLDSAPISLFAFAESITLTFNNNITPNKAVGILGAFAVSSGTFEVGGDITAYFSDVAAIQAVRDNADISLDIHAVKENAGFTIDLPLITLGDGRPSVTQDEPITLPLNMQAASGAQIDPSLDYTTLMIFWDYLPDVADR